MKNAILWKRILHEGMVIWPGDANGKELENLIIAAPIIVDTRPRDDRMIDVGQATGLGFPFQRFWIEGPLKEGPKPHPWGALVSAVKNDGVFNVTILGILLVENHPAWFGGYIFDANHNGDMLKKTRKLVAPKYLIDIMGLEEVKETCRGIQAMACDTMQMLGCKNIELAPRDNDPKQVRIANKRHGPSATGYRYHVLTVRPAGSKPGTPGEEIGNMPHHVCRGHFAEYGPQYGKGKLFGRLKGRFYIPPHMKGDKKNGTVLKDYQVVGAV